MSKVHVVLGRLAALVACVLLATAGGAHAEPTPASAFPAPVVVVYPFTTSGSIPAQAGGNLATLIVNRLVQLGGTDVRPYTPGTERRDYLTAAEKQNADYYVAGFLTPIGSEVSLIVQVVSTYGGTVVWSDTTSIRTYGEALPQADGIRDAILQHAGRSLSSLGAPPPAATPEPSSKDAAGLNLSRILGRRPHDVAVAASPAPAPALVANVDGTADRSARAYASTALAGALRAAGATRADGVAVASADAPGDAAALCKADDAGGTIYASSLAVDAANAVTLDVSAYDCTGRKIGAARGTATTRRHENVDRAIDRAAAQAAAALRKAGA